MYKRITITLLLLTLTLFLASCVASVVSSHEDGISNVYNLPRATLLYSTARYVSPNRGDPLMHEIILEGTQVFVVGRNHMRTHLRVIWDNKIGWIPVSFTDYNARQTHLSTLPIVGPELSECAVPIESSFSANNRWVSSDEQRIVITVDMMRPRSNEHRQSSLIFKVNGVEVKPEIHEIVRQKGVMVLGEVFTPLQKLNVGDVIEYEFISANDAPFTFIATIFQIPFSCVWSDGWVGFSGFSFYPSRTEFATQHTEFVYREGVIERLSHTDLPDLDNSNNEDSREVEIYLERNYRHQIIERLRSNEISGQAVRDQIVELYLLPPNDTEGAVQTNLCPISLEIPSGMKAELTVEWTERWASGIINRSKDDSGPEFGNFELFLGYVEPCSVKKIEFRR